MRETRGLNRLDCGIFAWTPDTEMSYAGMTEDTFAFLVQQGIQKADLVGISDGGQIALRLAFKHPEMVRRVVVFHFHQLVIESVAVPPASAGSLVLWDAGTMTRTSAALPCGQLLHDETGLNGLSKTHVVSD
jgi:pimeloyl-ACP methyl ester carboxylesterase